MRKFGDNHDVEVVAWKRRLECLLRHEHDIFNEELPSESESVYETESSYDMEENMFELMTGMNGLLISAASLLLHAYSHAN